MKVRGLISSDINIKMDYIIIGKDVYALFNNEIEIGKYVKIIRYPLQNVANIKKLQVIGIAEDNVSKISIEDAKIFGIDVGLDVIDIIYEI